PPDVAEPGVAAVGGDDPGAAPRTVLVPEAPLEAGEDGPAPPEPLLEHLGRVVAGVAVVGFGNVDPLDPEPVAGLLAGAEVGLVPTGDGQHLQLSAGGQHLGRPGEEPVEAGPGPVLGLVDDARTGVDADRFMDEA